MRLTFIGILFSTFFALNAQELSIGLMTSVKSKHTSVQVISGSYTLIADSTQIRVITSGISMQLYHESDKIQITLSDTTLHCTRLILQRDSVHSAFAIRSVSPKSKEHKYRENLEVKLRPGALLFINRVSMSAYLAGVIECEGGTGRALEYYKVQAIMSRTYAIENLRRHEKDGFNLCDDVHCQAYYNMQRFTPSIETAVKETDGEIMVDEEDQPVSGYFHANCGGQTSDASYVWNVPINSCQPFVDTFCIKTKQAKWVQFIPKSEWQKFLVESYGFPIDDPVIGPMAFNFEQEHRKAFFVHPALGIPLRDLRSQFKLKSTYFSVSDAGDKVKLEGRGFGHGIGLCQEGAMEMAKQGFTYRQIAMFYFNGVKIIDFHAWKFYNQDAVFMNSSVTPEK